MFLRNVVIILVAVLVWENDALAAPCDTSDPNNFVVSGITCELSGIHTFDTIQIINNARARVFPSFNGVDPIKTGNLELRANSILVDASSTVSGVGFRCCSNVAP